MRANGLAALSLRDIATTVGMRPPSLYSYFESKDAIYDAMYAQGCRQFADDQAATEIPSEPLAALKTITRAFVEFCAADPARYQLLFQRTIPGFEPSAESFAISRECLAELAARLGDAGLSDPGALDLFTALATGLADQQISNDPGGDRWIRLIDEAAEMFHTHITSRTTKPAKGRGTP